MGKDILEQNKKSILKKNRKKKIISNIFKSKELYLMILPVIIFYIIFAYIPMYGIIIAWKDYLPRKGILGSEWVGWKWFMMFFQRPEMFRALKNTLVISTLKILFLFPAPILLALLINEVKNEKYKNSDYYQTFGSNMFCQ